MGSPGHRFCSFLHRVLRLGGLAYGLGAPPRIRPFRRLPDSAWHCRPSWGEGDDRFLTAARERPQPSVPGKSFVNIDLKFWLPVALNQLDTVGEIPIVALDCSRSEERRVGKECRSRWSTYHRKKKNKTGGRVLRCT